MNMSDVDFRWFVLASFMESFMDVPIMEMYDTTKIKNGYVGLCPIKLLLKWSQLSLYVI